MKRWAISVLCACLFVILSVAGFNAYMDPHFQYSGVKAGISYALRPAEYTNPGILKNLPYDSVLIGSSMTANARASQLNDAMGLNTVKIIAFGARYCEFYDLLSLAFQSNQPMKHIFWGFDFHDLHVDEPIRPKDAYLYDTDVWNDVFYLLNKEVALRSAFNLYRTVRRMPPETFDTYARFTPNAVCSKEVVLRSLRYNRDSFPEEVPERSELPAVRDNLEKNVLSLVKAHPDTTFHFIISPFSIMYYDRLTHAYGRLDAYLANAEYAVEMLLQYENVKIYYFASEPDMICDLSHYKDVSHHDAGYNEILLQAVIDDNAYYQLTQENYKEKMQKTRELVKGYDYDGLFLKN